MENESKNTYNPDVAEILFGRHTREVEALFLEARKVIENQAAQIKSLQAALEAKSPKKG